MLNELMFALWETLYMVALSTLFSGIFGFAVAIVMILTGNGGLRSNKVVYSILNAIVNLLRSFQAALTEAHVPSVVRVLESFDLDEVLVAAWTAMVEPPRP